MSVGPRRRRSAKDSRREGHGKTGVEATRTCATGKRGHSSKSRAKKALKQANRERASISSARIETAVYLCRCGQWHLTSQQQR